MSPYHYDAQENTPYKSLHFHHHWAFGNSFSATVSTSVQYVSDIVALLAAIVNRPCPKVRERTMLTDATLESMCAGVPLHRGSFVGLCNGKRVKVNNRPVTKKLERFGEQE